MDIYQIRIQNFAAIVYTLINYISAIIQSIVNELIREPLFLHFLFCNTGYYPVFFISSDEKLLNRPIPD